ncbi:MAG: DUF3500 domain-containing protein [Bacteroidota bacterium]
MKVRLLLLVILSAAAVAAFFAFRCQQAKDKPKDQSALQVLTGLDNSADPKMLAAAQAFLASLSPEQKTLATFPLDSDERANWHFTVPRDRKGLVFKDMNPEQRRLCLVLVQTGLSQQGFAKSLGIMAWENVVSDHEGRERGNDFRHPEHYFLAIFGEPAADKPWGWRFEGHHLSLNYTSVGDRLSVTPNFMGANPGTATMGDRKGERILPEEEDLARRLVQSLDESQLRMAVISERAFPEIVTGAERIAALGTKQGLPYEAMEPEQQEMLDMLIKVYLSRAKPDIADKKWAKIQAEGLENLHFAWAGGLQPGLGHYYRIHGKSFLIEYDNTQNNANHIHTVWREFSGDFGRDLLREHYEKGHKH